jgi:tripartite-type tricarboxylate transporter receptor subunit TctC
MSRRAIVMMSVGLVFIVISVQTASAQKYPTKPIEILIPYTPGATMDFLARMVGDLAPKYLGQPIVPVNKVGAGGSVAAAEVISSRPDGYKLMVTTNFFFAMTTKTQKIPFDPYHLAPLTNFLEYRNGLMVRGDSPWKTLKDLLDFARKNPGKLRWSHTGRGISQHMYGLLLFRKAGVETVDIPYPGNPEMLSALLGGHLEASFMVYGGARDHVKTGRVRYLVTVSDHRYDVMPEVPSAAELGFPEVAKLPTYVGFYIHKDTPEEIKNTLIEAFRKINDDPEFRKRFDALGEDPKFAGPAFMKEAIKEGEQLAVPILKEFGLYVAGK